MPLNRDESSFVTSPTFEKLSKGLAIFCFTIGVLRLLANNDLRGFFAELLYSAACERLSKTLSETSDRNKIKYSLQLVGLFSLGYCVDSGPFFGVEMDTQGAQSNPPLNVRLEL